MQIIDRIKKIILTPKKFFKELKNEKDLTISFKYFATLLLLNSILGILVTLLFLNGIAELEISLAALGAFTTTQITLFFLILAIFGYLLSLGLSFVLAGILHVYLIIFNSKETYTKTYQLLAYSKTGTLLFSWIPILNYVTWIYTLFLLIIGSQQTHGFSKKKAILLFVIPTIIFIVLIGLFMLLMASIVSTIPQSPLAFV